MEVVSSLAETVKVPLGGDRVYKDECSFSFDGPEDDGGIYVCLIHFLGFGREFVDLHYKQAGCRLYLHTRKTEKPKPKPSPVKSDEAPPKKKPTRMALGVEGGFDLDEEPPTEYDESNCLMILPSFVSIALPCPGLPAKVQESVSGVLAAETAWKQEVSAAWEGEMKFESKHAAGLKQLDNRVKIMPSGWRCSQCDLTSNLWLNLTDGTILCGRRYFDGSGGNNHAVEHFNKTGYPLCAKLGTITASGADVYSYDEDAMVEDPLLAEHLAHFGINRMMLDKTDKTMEELEVEANLKLLEWDVIQESGCQLAPLFGPGHTGLTNLGNTCYMNSILQVLFTLPDFRKRYTDGAQSIFQSLTGNPTQDFVTQMAKLGAGLMSGRYSQPLDGGEKQEKEEEGKPKKSKGQRGIRPGMVKAIVGKGHPEFSTNRQQDAQEFFLHILNMIDRSEHANPGLVNPVDSFRFKVEERLECGESGQVRYTSRSDTLWSLPVPLEAAINKDKVQAWEVKRKEMEAKKEPIKPDDVVRPIVSLSASIAAFAQPETLTDFYSSAIAAKTTANKTTRFATFPDYLMIQMKKFTLGDDWVPKKIDVSIEVPDEINISDLQARGLQPGETELPEAEEKPEAPKIQIDEGLVQQLEEMGFAKEGCRKAVYHTNNAGCEAAMAWILEHMEDPDFSSPMEADSLSGSSTKFDEEAVMMLGSMGFNRDQAVHGLKATGGNLERAADWLFSHVDELDSLIESETASGASKRTTNDGEKHRTGIGKYKLAAFISHMGTSTTCGHYVCHVLKDGRWVIYNDRKVAVSEKPRRDLAYLYLFARSDGGD